MILALKWFVPITLAAMGLAWISEQVALLLGFEPPPQDLVKLFTNPNVAWQIKAKYAAIAVLLAPVLEELVFRMGLFRFCLWCGRRIKKADAEVWNGVPAFPAVSALISGAVFAAVHLLGMGVLEDVLDALDGWMLAPFALLAAVLLIGMLGRRKCG